MELQQETKQTIAPVSPVLSAARRKKNRQKAKRKAAKAGEIERTEFTQNPSVEIKNVENLGRGLFATKDFAAGEAIFGEFPLVAAPADRTLACAW